MPCTHADGCCKRHPDAPSCVGTNRAAGSDSAVVAANASERAVDQLGVPLLGLPPLDGAVTRTEAEETGYGDTRNRETNWLDAHPLHERRSRHGHGRRLALCLWGIAGVSRGSSRELKLNASSVFQSADTQIRHLLRPAEEAGWSTSIFAHSWSGGDAALQRAMGQAYPRLVAVRHGRLGELTMERVSSLVLSVVGSLELARAHATRGGFAFDLIFAARHDLFLHERIDLSRVEPAALTTALWCRHPAGSDRLATYGKGALGRNNSCGALSLPASSFGVADYFFVGGQQLMEWFWGSLQLARLSPLVRDARQPRQQLSFPQWCLNSVKWQREGFTRCQKNHGVIESHAAALGLRERGLLHTLPVVEWVHFTLYRSRGLTLQVPASDVSADHNICDGRRLCTRKGVSPSAAQAAAAWATRREAFLAHSRKSTLGS
jgi:hypothetical protein